MAAEILPVGMVEIAQRLGVQRATVDRWGQRGLLPDPDWTVGGRPAWNWATIVRWAVDTGRMVTVVELATAFGLSAFDGERAARFVGAFITPERYAKTGRIAPRWAGEGITATFTRDEVEELTAEWYRTERRVGTDAEVGVDPVPSLPIEQMPGGYRL